jgi:hypothetical protein
MVRKINCIPNIGEKINCLTVLDNNEMYINYKSGNRRAILCKCICGKEKLISLNKLTNPRKKVKSCGCNSYYIGQPKNALRNNPDSMYWELWGACKTSSKNRNLEFRLTKEKHKEIVNKNCFYCGQKPEMRTRGGISFFANGIDRVDSSMGYIEENCVPSCRICNNMKWETPVDEFLDHIEKIVKYNNLL